MKYINWLLVVFATIFFVSCENGTEDDSIAMEPKLKATPSEVSMSSAEGETNFSLTANYSWTVSGAPDWLTVSPESGEGSLYKQTITLSAEQNTGALREATLLFASEGLTCEVKVKQASVFGADAPQNALFFESFKTGVGAFTIEDVKLTGPVSYVWEHSSQYTCMKATAYVNNSNHESESWLISPKVDLTSVDAAYFTFEHAGMYFGDITKEATVWVSKDGVDWVQLEIADEDYPTSWGFLSAGNWDLSEYLGGKVQFGFKFMSTATKSGTWEIRNVAVVSGTPEDDALPIVDPTKASWLELPATDNENLQYFTHRYEMNNQIHRNYTFAWSQKDLVSVWVAYPLCLTYMKNNVERTDAWAYDPYLKKPLSSAPFSYYAGDYDRGHQLPSADRLCSLAANKQTFYGTNIVPQSNAHNVGVWDDLEIHIRDRIASLSDTTYVVTGCVVDGATEFSTDSDGKKITIPVAFFKAVLKYKKGATTEWAAAGFYTKHEGSGGDDLKSIAMSIDELEEKLGLDFFVNLEGQIGKDAAAAVEAKDPAALL